MDELNQALGDISDLRRQVAATTQFRGYGPATLFTTAILALCAAIAQNWLVGDAAVHPRAYTAIWAATALVSIVITGVQMLTRSRRMHSSLSDEMIRMAVFPFARGGMVSAAMLALGRALGETMAVTMVLSASGVVTFQVLTSTNPTPIPANIALKFGEAHGTGVNALIATGLILFLVTFAVNAFAVAPVRVTVPV